MRHPILITGANRGIGLELTRKLAVRGEAVIATARRPHEATALHDLDVEVAPLDVTDPQSVEALREHLEDRPLDLLVNNAGLGGAEEGIDRLDPAYVEELLRVNTVGPLRVTQALLPHLRRGTRKAVLHLSSQLGSIALSDGGKYGYRASKAALNMWNRSLALELQDEGFTCMVVHPGWVRT